MTDEASCIAVVLYYMILGDAAQHIYLRSKIGQSTKGTAKRGNQTPLPFVSGYEVEEESLSHLLIHPLAILPQLSLNWPKWPLSGINC